MRLSYSLLEHYQSCQFRSKVFDFDRAVDQNAIGSRFNIIVGQLAHEAQSAVILGQDPKAQVEYRLQREREVGYPEGYTPERLVERVLGMVERWARSTPSFDPKQCQPVKMLEPGSSLDLIDRRLLIPLDPPVGMFTELVIRPDLVCRYGSEGFLRLYDWKWVSALDDIEDSPYQYDLQSAIYQWGLAQLGLEVKCHGIVQGLIEEPTPFRLNKTGEVSKRAVRNSWEEYVRACAAAGHEPDEAMRVRLTPTFRHHINFRSRAEVDAIWRETVVPTALQITRSAEGAGFARKFSKAICGRCSVRFECQQGQVGHSAIAAFNSIHPVQKEVA